MTSLHVQCGLASHPGRVRGENEDSSASFEVVLPPLRPQDAPSRAHVAVVADGVGGEAGGATASTLAVATLHHRLAQATSLRVREQLETAFQEANDAILAASANNPVYGNMATTLVAAVIHGHWLYLAHLGDSRAYLLRNGRLAQLTVDHSWVQQEQDAGRLDARTAATHPQRNLILRYLGCDDFLAVDHAIVAPGAPGAPGGNGLPPLAERSLLPALRLQPADVLLLSSDGLHGSVPLPELARALRRMPAPAAAGSLVAAALRRGGEDNISAVVVAVSADAGPIPGQSAIRWVLAVAMTAAALIFLAMLVRTPFGSLPTLQSGQHGEGSTATPAGQASATAPAANPHAAALTTASPSATMPRPAPSATLAPAATPTASATTTPYPSSTPKPTFTATATPTMTPTPTNTPTSTYTPFPTVSQQNPAPAEPSDGQTTPTPPATPSTSPLPTPTPVTPAPVTLATPTL